MKYCSNKHQKMEIKYRINLKYFANDLTVAWLSKVNSELKVNVAILTEYQFIYFNTF